MKAVHLRIHGRVQGVFFRSESRAKARELGLSGWVKNTDDDRVEILAQGPEPALLQFIDWCKKGPPHAHVDRVDVTWTEPNKKFSEFMILYS